MNVKYGYTPNKNYIVDIDMTNKSIVEIIVKISEACKIVDEHQGVIGYRRPKVV